MDYRVAKMTLPIRKFRECLKVEWHLQAVTRQLASGNSTCFNYLQKANMVAF